MDLSQLRVRIKNLESQIDDSLLAVRANLHTINNVFTVLIEYLGRLESSKQDIDSFISHLGLIRTRYNEDFDMTTMKLESSRCKLQSCIQMASSFAELMNGQSLSQNGQSLRRLAEEQGEEAHHMAALADKSRRDAIAIKGLSIVTLVYLPTTVVLNFFSASFIDTSSSRMKLVGKWWLFLVVGVPLTIITLTAWALWMKFGTARAMATTRTDEEVGHVAMRTGKQHG